MIKNKQDFRYYVDCDRIARGFPKPTLRHKIKDFIYTDPTWKFQKLLRKVEYFHNKKKTLFNGLGTFYWSINSKSYQLI